LAQLEPRAARHPIPLKVAFTTRVTCNKVVQTQPRTVPGKIRGLQILEPAEAALYCGSAGIYNLVRPGPAKERSGTRSLARS
jgi:glycolate oxidase iron-sulfur subunit